MEFIDLPLQFEWKIARGGTRSKRNAIVRCESDGFTGIGETAPNIRYGETPDALLTQFDQLRDQLNDWSSLTPRDFHNALIRLEVFHALQFAIETAYLDRFMQQHGWSWEQITGIPPASSTTTAYSLPILPIHELIEWLPRFERFPILKIKVDRDTATDTLTEVMKRTRQPLIIDANESWTDPDEIVNTLSPFDPSRFRLLEQPMPAKLGDAYRYLKTKINIPVFADESVENDTDISALSDQFDGINIKLMKSGSVFTAIEQIRAARDAGMDVMLGCMVETSLALSQAVRISALADVHDLDAFLYLKSDPFSRLHESNGIISLT